MKQDKIEEIFTVFIDPTSIFADFVSPEGLRFSDPSNDVDLVEESP